ncbi:MAG: hypothetical protein IJX12_05815, partial [Lachnospiraceae bacterium]|nr:hypothetical protein [Lachnospiraceae bacterium]
ALCASIYEMITCTKTPSSKERQSLDTLVSPSARGVYISPICDAAIMNGLALNPDERIKNATDLYYFLYVYGRDVNATPEGMKKKIKDSSTKVIIDKIKRESLRRKNNRNAFVAIVIITLLGCGIILVGQLGKILKKDDGPIIITDVNGEKDSEITVEDLESYREDFYTYINSERDKQGTGDVDVYYQFENVANECIEELTKMSCNTTEEWNAQITACVTEKMSDAGITNTGWLVLPYTTDFSIGQAYKDATANILAINGDAIGAIDLMNCSKIGISIGVHGDGTIFIIFIYK